MKYYIVTKKLDDPLPFLSNSNYFLYKNRNEKMHYGHGWCSDINDPSIFISNNKITAMDILKQIQPHIGTELEIISEDSQRYKEFLIKSIIE